MPSETTDLIRCKQLIEAKLDWGSSEHWHSIDFENLHNRILEETGVALSASTLRRVWGRVEYNHLPSVTTLNTLARFAGYSDWRTFQRLDSTNAEATNSVDDAPPQNVRPSNRWTKWAWAMIAVLFLSGLTTLVSLRQNQSAKAARYTFTSQRITRTIPNSVVFRYDASASPTDSVYIQQSWDARRRTRVAKEGPIHTSVYYEPGFYRAKLLVGNQVVGEHSLLIPTQGWLGLIDRKPVPLYLKTAEFSSPDALRLPAEVIEGKHLTLQPHPPLVKYYNVGNFEPIPLADFSMTTLLKNEYGEGTATCQRSWVILITDGMPLVIPLSGKGCVSDLTLVDGVSVVSGKKTDLSKFGVDFSTWIRVSCRSKAGRIHYSINDLVAYTSKLPARQTMIVGLAFVFEGTGSVRGIELRAKEKAVFQDFEPLSKAI